ncbi:hypothetical protein GCM10007935_40120 [Hydrogenophaga electricum]|uniref:Uncharacterized protein n=1 Tax=Hydrogenophaga electricum TaxID=1230953 RepID=A0ABQ6CCP0_9BURK|nr:hypothetical protein GCM10007935_40120 [Hydrogenophaga electricum]
MARPESFRPVSTPHEVGAPVVTAPAPAGLGPGTFYPVGVEDIVRYVLSVALCVFWLWLWLCS